MDPEKRARRQSLRIIISESIMVVSVILLVIILALLVSGYWLNSDFKVERQGMLQISSVPSGANVEVDGDAPWFQRTNTSKVLSSGEHTVSLKWEGYDTWSKTIDIREGLLYRIHYPRLFLLEREVTPVYNLADANFITISPDRSKMLVVNPTTAWSVFDLTNEKLVPKPYAVLSVLPDDDESGAFNGRILSADWDSSNEHVLMHISFETHTEWILFNVNNPANSINITEEFAISNLDAVEILNNSASQLLALRNGNLLKIDVAARQISAPLATNVQSFDHYGSEIIYATAPKYELNLLQGDSAPKNLMTLDAPAKVFISRFYDDKYITVVSDTMMAVYNRNSLEEVVSFELDFAPATSKIGGRGEFVAMMNGTHIGTLDMESLELTEWDIESSHYGWLDDSMFYAIKDGVLSVYDFDGLNHRTLSQKVASNFPVTITDDKWLYYISGVNLVREIITR